MTYTTSPSTLQLDMVRNNSRRWTSEEHQAFLSGLRLYGRNWEAIASMVPTRTVRQIRTHSQKYFVKIEQGKEFPDEPYVSQNEAAAGQAGAAAGAYLYDSQQQQQPQPQLTPQQNEQLQAGAGTSVAGVNEWMQATATLPPPHWGGGDGGGGGGSGGGGVGAGRRYPGLLIGRERQVVEMEAATAGPLEFGNYAGTGASFMMLPPVAPSGHGGRFDSRSISGSISRSPCSSFGFATGYPMCEVGQSCCGFTRVASPVAVSGASARFGGELVAPTQPVAPSIMMP
ncbi:unnamed protein product [Pylaiella littoralis]